MTFDELLIRLERAACDVDASGRWPQTQFNWLAEAGVLGWSVPQEYGGQDIDTSEWIERYQQLAAACLTTCFALTQRNGACQRIAGCENRELKQELLPELASGSRFATVGISHLTTSRQHLRKPVVEVAVEGGEYVLNGLIPWVTGAAAADIVVSGGTLDDGRQVLIALPADLPGVSVKPRTELMALTASETRSIELTQVRVPERFLIAGPVENVMNSGTGGGAGSLTTSALALGVSRRSLKLLEQEAVQRDDLCRTVASFRDEVVILGEQIAQVACGDAGEDLRLTPAAIRQRSNSLVLRITQAALTVTKGAGFVKGHPAELAVREAMFFLVWSCPQPVAQGVLQELTCREGFSDVR